MIHGWTTYCGECGTLLQIITDGQDEFRARLEAGSKQTGARIIGLLNEELGAWGVLPDEHDVAVCPVCHHSNKLLRPPSGSDLN